MAYLLDHDPPVSWIFSGSVRLGVQVTIDDDALHATAELIASRRSIRRYRTEAVPDSIVEALLKCAVNAPSAHNRQPWRFAILSSHGAKVRLANAMGACLRADRLTDGDLPSTIESDVARSYERITHAPVVVLVATTTADMDVYCDFGRRNTEYLMAVQSTVMAVQNLLLAAHAAGLGACWMCAPVFCPDVVRDALCLAADWQAQALVTLGLPASAGKPYSRRALKDVVLRIEDE